MERLAYYIMLAALEESVKVITTSLIKSGSETTLANLDTIFPKYLIKNAYNDIYYQVGNLQKQWAEADLQTRIPRAKHFYVKEEDDRFRRRPTKPPVIIDTNFNLGFFNPKWLARLKNIVNSEDVASRVTSVTDTIKKKIKESIGQAQQEFVSIRKIAARLRQDMPTFSRRRSETIARTEVTNIANIAAEESADELTTATGIKLLKSWVHTLDSRTRDSHAKVPIKPIEPDAFFVVGGKKMSRPGDPRGGIANIINCRCVLAYFPADDYEDLF